MSHLADAQAALAALRKGDHKILNARRVMDCVLTFKVSLEELGLNEAEFEQIKQEWSARMARVHAIKGRRFASGRSNTVADRNHGLLIITYLAWAGQPPEAIGTTRHEINHLRSFAPAGRRALPDLEPPMEVPGPTINESLCLLSLLAAAAGAAAMLLARMLN